MAHRSPVGNVASTKFPSPRPPTVPSFLMPSFLVASRSLAPVCFHSQLRCFSFWSIYPPFALGLLRSPRSSFRPSIYPCLSLTPSLIYEQLLLIYRSFWFSRRFHRNATREKGRRWRIGTSPWLKERRVANGNMMEQDRNPLSSERSAASLFLAKKGESSWFKFYRADNTVTAMLWFIACLRDEGWGWKVRRAMWKKESLWSEVYPFMRVAIRDPGTSALSPFSIALFSRHHRVHERPPHQFSLVRNAWL